jgi:hypothetical protein
VNVPSSELGSPNPSLAIECSPPPITWGGGHTGLRVRGCGSPNSDDLRKSITLCLLCEYTVLVYYFILAAKLKCSQSARLAGLFANFEISGFLTGVLSIVPRILIYSDLLILDNFYTVDRLAD